MTGSGASAAGAPQLSTEQLRALETAVVRALQTGRTGELEVLGYGEISSVVGWPLSDGTRVACKRLPPFASEEQLRRYRTCFETYLDRLSDAGIQPQASGLQSLTRGGGTIVAYCIQPALRADDLLVRRLWECHPERGRALFQQVLDAIEPFVSDRRGLDGQLSNWALVDDQLVYLDVTTPLLRDETGAELLDTDLFLASLPWALRGVVRRWMLSDIVDKYYDLRGVVLDLLGNLIKEGLTAHLDGWLTVANQRLGDRPLEAGDVWRYYRSDARLWALLQRLRRIDRAWQRSVRRRRYEFLLPGAIERRV